MRDSNKKRRSRQDNWEDLNANINRAGNIDNPDTGYANMDDWDKGRISREIKTHKEEVAPGRKPIKRATEKNLKTRSLWQNIE